MFRGVCSIQDQARSPDQLELVDGLLLVWDGIQGVAPHYFVRQDDLTMEDPPVYEGDADDLDSPLTQVADSLSGFLTQRSVHDVLLCVDEKLEGEDYPSVLGQVVESARGGQFTLQDSKELERIAQCYPRLEVPSAEGIGVFGDENTLLFLFNRPGFYHLAAARTASAWSELLTHVPLG